MKDADKIQELKLLLKIIREQVQYQENYDELIKNN